MALLHGLRSPLKPCLLKVVQQARTSGACVTSAKMMRAARWSPIRISRTDLGGFRIGSEGMRARCRGFAAATWKLTIFGAVERPL
jgi:hypothetical protein